MAFKVFGRHPTSTSVSYWITDGSGEEVYRDQGDSAHGAAIVADLSAKWKELTGSESLPSVHWLRQG